MHWKKFVKPDAPYFGEADFDRVDQTFIVTIKCSKTEQIKSKKGVETHGVLYFEEDVKPLILNKTNGETIAKLYGKHVEEWEGRQIMLYYDPNVYFGREKVGGVRVDDPKKALPPPIPCESCGQPVTSYGRMNAAQMAQYTAGKYGRTLCAECAKEAAKERSDAQ